MTLNLEGAGEKVERAKEQIQQLATEITEFGKRNTYRGILEFDAQGGHYFKNFDIWEDPSLRWAVITGEILHNLRSSLDHLACQFALANGRPDCEGKDVTFPVFHDLSRKKVEAMYKRIMQNFPQSAEAIIDGLQPYHEPRTADQTALFVLNELNRRDKHQLVNLVLMLIAVGPLMTERPHNVREYLLVEPQLVGGVPIVKAGAMAYVLRIPDAGREVDVYAELRPDVVFDKSGPGQGEPIIPLLQQLADFTERIINRFG